MKSLYIVIIGGGTIGYYLSKALLSEGHEVLIIEKEQKKCEQLEDILGSCCLRGDGCETAVLDEAGLTRADVVIATTSHDEDNLVSCQVAKYRFKVKRTIALVNNPNNDKIFKRLGVDSTISVTNTILQHIEQELPEHPLIHLLTVSGQKEEIVELSVASDSPALGKAIKQLNLPQEIKLLLLFKEGDRASIPNTETVLLENDRIIALTSVDQEKKLRKILIG